MDIYSALVESWLRQCSIIDGLASRLDPALMAVRPSEDGWSLGEHLRHLNRSRRYWLGITCGKSWQELEEEFARTADANPSLDEIRADLASSRDDLAEWFRQNLGSEGAAGPYDHPVLFLQHMVWHEGWHAGLIMLGLRLAGHEPPEEWEDPNVWGKWRNYG